MPRTSALSRAPAPTEAPVASAPGVVAPAARPTPPGTGLSPAQRALRKLGLVRDIDFALYLPMRYEDETRVVRLADPRDGDTAQIEGVVTEAEVAYRPRRQLIVTIDDGGETCVPLACGFRMDHPGDGFSRQRRIDRISQSAATSLSRSDRPGRPEECKPGED